MKNCFFLLLISFTISTVAQSSFGKRKDTAPVIYSAADFEKGIFASFEDFLNGRPFLQGWKFDSVVLHIRDAVYCKSDISWRNSSYDDKDPFYPCNHSEEKLKKTFIEVEQMNLDTVWGFNDGFYIYCKIAGNFYPIVNIGNYSIVNFYKSYKPNIVTYPDYEKIDNQVNAPYLDAQDYARKEFAKDINYPSTSFYGSKSKQYLLSMTTGSIIKLTDETLMDILKKDADLYQEYMNVKHTPEINRFFLLKYNKQFPVEF